MKKNTKNFAIKKSLVVLVLLTLSNMCIFGVGTKDKPISYEEHMAPPTVVATYDDKVPSNIQLNDKYKIKTKYIDFGFIRTKVGELRSEPNFQAKIIKTYSYMDRFKLIEKVYSRSSDWYLVEHESGARGYIVEEQLRKRIFRFQKALDKIIELEKFIGSEMDKGREIVRTNTYSPNPANKNAKLQKDKYGTSWEQNAISKTASGETIYIPDSSIMSIISTNGSTSKVKVASIAEELTVSNSLLSKNPKINRNFKKVVAVDIENQNTTLFEKNASGKWEIVSYVYAKTGVESTLGYETPKGYFIVPLLKYVMGYTDAQGRHEGNAKYAMRFSGGGYLHGTPVAFPEESRREHVMKQRNQLLGLYTGTRKCIRTTEAHAKFMFDWMCSNPVKSKNEQVPSENVMFIVF
ncbi:L,D-transpeptidase family protein [Fusobacterium sp. PH5-44]|uniref:L,D-transpeptidase family protein n=1 Tax=unclassified Fusobacterium TaxID=2648384 RepID=UPI003D1BA152